MRRARLAAAAGLLLVGTAGCGSAHTAPASPAPPPTESAAPTSSPFPPRPAELRLDGVDPCQLLTQAQAATFNAHLSYTADEPEPAGPDTDSCTWFTNETYSKAWTAVTWTKQGAPATLNSSDPTQIVQIDGFGAIQGSTTAGVKNQQCGLFIDVAQGEHLMVTYDALGREPGLTYQVACQKATRAATLMIQNLRALTH